jgi:4-diphosphocytidyl-2-C-methyl-D-erythritol kinase
MCVSKNTYNFTFFMLCFPNCKINLGLYVTGRRTDGYHDIETVFYPIGLCDMLEVVPAANTTEAKLHLAGIHVTGPITDNLVWRAYELLHKNFPGKIAKSDVYLHKIVPMGAGLGGGSADGAYMLRLLNDYSGLGLSLEQLGALALELGSDCPFFIRNKPQFASGRGEIMVDTDVDLSAYSIQLVCADVPVSTREAYALIKPRPAAFDLRELPGLPIDQWASRISNDFEAPVFERYPLLAELKGQLLGQGALYAAMSGSGSAIFGIFPKSQKAVIKAAGAAVFYLE